MAKKIDITDKLDFSENPVMKIEDIEVEVKGDAETMLRLMGVFANNSEMQAVGEALNLIFSPEDMEKICSLEHKGKKLSAKSLMTIVQKAMELVMGEDEEGEQ